MWVRSEYAGELAVLSAWLCTLLPWSISYANPEGAHLVRVHFLPVYFQFAPGSGLAGVLDTAVLAVDAASFADNPSATFGYRLWVLGAAAFAVAFALSLLYYRMDERLPERLPVDPVRLMGGLLVASGLPLAAGTYLVNAGTLGVTFPVGVVFMFVLGGLLLVVERTDDTDRTSESTGPDAETTADDSE